MKKKFKKVEPYIWILPSVLLMAIFILVPIIFVFRMALSDVSKAGLIKGFAGLENFRKVTSSPVFSMVLKNTLVRRALKELNIEGLDEVLNGPSAFAFGMNDPVSPAKIINDFIVKKKSEAIEIKAGLLGNELMSMEQIKALAEMPSREVLLARLVGSLQSSIASFVRVLDAIAKKDSEAAPEA